MPEERLRRLETEVKEIRKSRDSHHEDLERIEKCVIENTRSIDNLTDAVETQAKSTEGVVKTFEELVAFATVGKRVHTFLWSVAKIPLIGTGLYQLIKWLIDHMPEV